MHPAIQLISEIFEKRGNGQYGSEAVTQLQHALQCAVLAEEEGAKPGLVAAALLHDIGHIFDDRDLPDSCEGNLDDRHEFRGNEWLKLHFGAAVADPVRLHVAAKRYLCTVDGGYEGRLSPTSFKSYHDQGGPMNEDEQVAFERELFYADALKLRRWDDLGKDPSMLTPPISHFLPVVDRCLIGKEEEQI